MMAVLVEHFWDVAITVSLALIIAGLILARTRESASSVAQDSSERTAISKKTLSSQTVARQRGYDRRVSSRTKWDIVLALAGLSYVGLALCLNLDSPLFVIAFALLAAYEKVGRS